MKKFLPVFLLSLFAFTGKAQTNDTLICDYPDRDTLEFENLPWVGNNGYLEHFLDSIIGAFLIL